jgi:DNA-binding transcriptional MerR regulator
MIDMVYMPMTQALYPIRAVSRLTGLPADTLRAWERRYGVVTPQRTAKRRVYTAQDVKRLVLLREVTARGHSIGRVAKLADARLRDLLQVGAGRFAPFPLPSDRERPELSLEALIHSIDRFDYLGADRELSRLAAIAGSPRRIVHDVALPLMRMTGLRWHEGRFGIAQEHMVTALLSNLLAAMIRLYSPDNPAARVLFATLPGEQHGFGILAAAMLASASGLGIIYLGTDVPPGEVALAARKGEAHAVLVGSGKEASENWSKDLLSVSAKVPHSVQLWFGGVEEAQPAKITTVGRWRKVTDFHHLEQLLTGLGGRF